MYNIAETAIAQYHGPNYIEINNEINWILLVLWEYQIFNIHFHHMFRDQK